MPTFCYVFWTYLVAAIILAVVVKLTGDSLLPSNGREWRIAILLALLPTLLGHTPLNAALRHLPATVVSTAFLGEVVGGSLLVWVALREPPPANFPWGGGLIAVGIILVAITRGGKNDRVPSATSGGAEPPRAEGVAGRSGPR